MKRISFGSALKILLSVTGFALVFGLFFGQGAFLFPVLFFLGLAFIFGSFYFSKEWFNSDLLLYKIERQPLTEIENITIDNPTAVYGTIECDSPLAAKHSEKECVFYHYIRERYVKSGKHHKWKIVENIIEYAKFQINDLTGKITVDMRNIDSDLSAYWNPHFTAGTIPRINPFVHAKTGNIANKSIADFKYSEVDAERSAFQEPTHERSFLGLPMGSDERVSEFVLELGEKAFVYGWVYGENNEKVIAESKGCPLIVSRKKKEEFLKDFSVGENFFYTDNFLILFGLVIWLPLFLFFGFSAWLLGLAAAIVFIKMAFEIYNRMIELNKRIENAKSQISIELKKRADLIPNLEKTVKGYSKFEKSILEIISNLRAGIGLDSKGMKDYSENQERITGIIATIEAYPELKSNSLFKNFIARLSQTENNIAYYRSFYNDTVLKYNTMISIFPFSILAKKANLKEAEFWKND